MPTKIIVGQKSEHVLVDWVPLGYRNILILFVAFLESAPYGLNFS